MYSQLKLAHSSTNGYTANLDLGDQKVVLSTVTG